MTPKVASNQRFMVLYGKCLTQCLAHKCSVNVTIIFVPWPQKPLAVCFSELLYYLCFCITQLPFSHSSVIQLCLSCHYNKRFFRNYNITYQTMLNRFNWLKNNCSDSPTSLSVFCKPRTQTIKGEFLTRLLTPQLFWAQSSQSGNRNINPFSG